MSTQRMAKQRPDLNERAIRIALESLTVRSHRLWLSEPADQRRSLPLCEELFDVQIQIQRLELKLQAQAFRDEHLSLLDLVSGRVDQLENDWHDGPSLDNPTRDESSRYNKKEPLPWT